MKKQNRKRLKIAYDLWDECAKLLDTINQENKVKTE